MSLSHARDIGFVLVALLGLSFCAPPNISAGPDQDSINSYIETTIDRYDIPLLTVVVVKNGIELQNRTYSSKKIEIENDAKYRLYHTASVSKIFVATAIMQLESMNELSINDQVSKYIPEIASSIPGAELITLKQLLSHTSGLPDISEPDWTDDDDLRSAAVKFAVGKSLLSNPGENWSYSNYGYNLLGVVIEEVTRLPFQTAMDSLVLSPLAMETGTFGRPDLATGMIINGYVGAIAIRESELYPWNFAYAPSGGLTMSGDDASNALKWFSQPRVSAPPLNRQNLERQWERVVSIDEVSGMGLGWFIRSINEKTVYYHEGSDPGFRAYFAVSPGDKTGVAVMSNYQRAPVRAIAEAVFVNLWGLALPAPPQPPLARRMEELRAEAGINRTIEEFSAEIVEMLPSLFPAYLFMWNLLSRNLTEDALVASNFYLSLTPDDFFALRENGRILVALGQPTEAMEVLEKARMLNPNDSQLLEIIDAASRLEN